MLIMTVKPRTKAEKDKARITEQVAAHARRAAAEMTAAAELVSSNGFNPDNIAIAITGQIFNLNRFANSAEDLAEALNEYGHWCLVEPDKSWNDKVDAHWGT